MSYYCTDCGRVFDEPYSFTECVGEFWGAPAYQSFSECPYCGGGYEEAEPCGWCGTDHNPEEMMYFPASGYDMICRDCFAKECEPYKDEFLSRSMGDPEDPAYTWREHYEYVKSVPVFKVNSFFDFICWEESANEPFFLFVKEKKIREAAERGRAANAKIHYQEVKK